MNKKNLLKKSLTITFSLGMILGVNTQPSLASTAKNEGTTSYVERIEKFKNYEDLLEERYGDDIASIQEELSKEFPDIILEEYTIQTINEGEVVEQVTYNSVEELVENEKQDTNTFSTASISPGDFRLTTAKYWDNDSQRYTILHEFDWSDDSPEGDEQPWDVFWFKFNEDVDYDYVHLDLALYKGGYVFDGYKWDNINGGSFDSGDYVAMAKNDGMEGLAFWIHNKMDYGELWIGTIDDGNGSQAKMGYHYSSTTKAISGFGGSVSVDGFSFSVQWDNNVTDKWSAETEDIVYVY